MALKVDPGTGKIEKTELLPLQRAICPLAEFTECSNIMGNRKGGFGVTKYLPHGGPKPVDEVLMLNI